MRFARRARAAGWAVVAAGILAACPGPESPSLSGAPAASKPASRQPRPAVRGLGPKGELRPYPADRCPVCAMRPAKNPKSAAGLTLVDGRTFYFCGNGCLLRTLRAPQTYLGVTKDRVARTSVLDYFTGQPVSADAAHWVAGSDVVGPMGPATVALSSEAAAARFIERHGGTFRFQLSTLDEAGWNQLFNKKGKHDH